MDSLEFATSNTGLLPARRSRRTAVVPRLESDAVAGCLPPAVTEARRGTPKSMESVGPFTEAEIRAMQNDDAMAAGVIGTILSLAFVTLLSLTVAVNIWMQSIAR